MQQILLRAARRLSINQRKFVAEVIGTFIVVVFATGSVVIDSKMHGVLGVPFIAFAPFVGVATGVYLFGRISMAHFNPAVTFGFLITRHITKRQLVYYLAAEITGALLGSLFVKFVIGDNANLWCFYESSSLISTCIAIWYIGESVALLVCHFVGTSIAAFFLRKKFANLDS